jgi:hypothetical protein
MLGKEKPKFHDMQELSELIEKTPGVNEPGSEFLDPD